MRVLLFKIDLEINNSKNLSFSRTFSFRQRAYLYTSVCMCVYICIV